MFFDDIGSKYDLGLVIEKNGNSVIIYLEGIVFFFNEE